MKSHPIAATVLTGVLAALASPASAQEASASDAPLDEGSVETGKIVVGQPLPDVRLPTLDRERAVRLSSFRGKKLLLIEFASW